MSKPTRRQASYLSMHARSFIRSLGDLTRQPIGNAMTILVIAIAIVLPALFYFVGMNVKAVADRWHDQPQISLYLTNHTNDEQARQLTEALQKRDLVASVIYISPDQGWEALDQVLHLKTLKEQLGTNPLPGIIRVTPRWPGPTPEALKKLTDQLGDLSHVQDAELDVGWVKRLYYILNIAQRLLIGVGCLFALAVVLIIANTIRLSISKHEREMAILTLLGASKSFIVRPFLYRGFVYGLLGGVLARVALWALSNWLSEPVQQLSATYLSQFSLHELDALASAILIVGSGLLGWVGAKLATSTQIAKHL